MNIMQKLLLTIQCQMYSLHSAKEEKTQQHDNLKHLQNEIEKYANKSNIKIKETTTTWKFI